jgi:hypothetical protein
MIHDQETPSYQYHPSRVSFFNIAGKKAEPATNDLYLDLSNPRSALLYWKIATKLTNYQLIGIPFVQEYLMAQYR